jgi:hypothetical protein
MIHNRAFNSNLKSAYVLHLIHIKHEYGPMDIAMSLLHPAHKGRRMTSLENLYIQLFQWRNTIIKEQSQKDTNPLFSLMYYTQLTDACTWSPSTSLPYILWSQSSVVGRYSKISKPLLGTYLTDSRFISVLHYIILSINVLPITSYAHLFLYFQDDNIHTFYICYLLHTRIKLFICILNCNTYFKPVIFIFNIWHVIGSHNFCNISMYLFFVTHLPEDGHMSGRNM